MVKDSKCKLPKVFIVSSGRSGTTLLASMLNASDQLYIPYESDFIARAYPYFRDQDSFDACDYQLIAKLFQITSKQRGWGMPENYLFQYLCSKSPQTYAEVNAIICEAFHKQEGTENLEWGIKAPVLIASLDRITDVCPKSKITHIVRDGRDVYLSYRRVHESSEVKFGPKGVIASALYWVDGLRRLEEVQKTCSNIRLFEIRYKDLLAEPRKKLTQLCGFIGIRYKPDMHESFNQKHLSQKVAPDQFKQSIHKKLHKGLDPQNTEKYRTQMSRYELIIFESIAAPYLAKYHYSLQYPVLNSVGFSPIRVILYTLARLFNDWRYARRDQKMYRIAYEALEN